MRAGCMSLQPRNPKHFHCISLLIDAFQILCLRAVFKIRWFSTNKVCTMLKEQYNFYLYHTYLVTIHYRTWVPGDAIGLAHRSCAFGSIDVHTAFGDSMLHSCNDEINTVGLPVEMSSARDSGMWTNLYQHTHRFHAHLRSTVTLTCCNVPRLPVGRCNVVVFCVACNLAEHIDQSCWRVGLSPSRGERYAVLLVLRVGRSGHRETKYRYGGNSS